MVRELASQFGGALTIESRPSAGTRIDIWLPISSGAAGPASIAEGTNPEAFKGRVLVVDDEPLVRMTTADRLQNPGYETKEAEDAGEAERCILDGQKFDLVASDYLMPGMPAVELAKAIRERCPDVSVLIVSGYAETKGSPPNSLCLASRFDRSNSGRP